VLTLTTPLITAAAAELTNEMATERAPGSPGIDAAADDRIHPGPERGRRRMHASCRGCQSRADAQRDFSGASVSVGEADEGFWVLAIVRRGGDLGKPGVRSVAEALVRNRSSSC
jgi:hypothetical protein